MKLIRRLLILIVLTMAPAAALRTEPASAATLASPATELVQPAQYYYGRPYYRPYYRRYYRPYYRPYYYRPRFYGPRFYHRRYYRRW